MFILDHRAVSFSPWALHPVGQIALPSRYRPHRGMTSQVIVLQRKSSERCISVQALREKQAAAYAIRSGDSEESGDVDDRRVTRMQGFELMAASGTD
ncbi:hypothetical protein [Ensifer sesbaniae]|uniref:hypothetical protein n=1 Tax=Ensifer sesbaniae TaxID=1214071 RepID=UPI0015697988|nr:hypothetical protein [Ensifer sesbaniae]